MNRPTVLLLFGGESSEHDVSISSARNVYAAVDDTKFEVLLGYIDRDGKWWLVDSIDGDIAAHDGVQLLPLLGGAGFTTAGSDQPIVPDVLLPILHGKNGEDGSVQGLAQLLHIPIVGCGVVAGSVCMDKILTKEIVSFHHIEVAPYVTCRQGEQRPDFNQLSMSLGMPLFVKPSRAGSSVGVSKVYSEEELSWALDLAFEHDCVVLIERGISGRELEVAVLGNPPHQRASAVGEIVLHNDFYSYEAKYAPTSQSQTIIPAELPDDVASEIQRQAARAYQALDCKGLARVDFFLADDGTIYLNEVNTMPGFTNISMYPKLWRQAGIGYGQLIEQLINLARDTIDTPIEEEV